MGRIRSTFNPHTVRAIKRAPSHKYPRITLSANGVRGSYFVHDLVAETWLGPRPVGTEVNHKDRDHGNNAPDNLEYLTHVDNVRHWRKTPAPPSLDT
jgi:hypothetical protein